MEKICKNCKYEFLKENYCRLNEISIAHNDTCKMWKPDLKKLINEIKEEACKNGACEV